MTSGLPPLAAEIVFNIGSLPVTNSMVNAFVATVLFAVAAFFLNLGIKKYYVSDSAPRGFLNFVEGVVEFLLGYVDNVTKDRKKSLRLLPIVGTLFLFILISNWMGLIPGTSSILHSGIADGHISMIPLFRPADTDLNLTLAMAVLTVIGSHILGVVTIGFFKYSNRFIKLGDLYHAVKSFKPINILTAIIEFFVGIIEIFSEVAKMVSLSLRLFGNIFAGEVLLTVLGSLIGGYGAFLIPLPFMALELLVGFIQATVFSMLALVYLTMATTDTHGHAETGDDGGAAEAEENQVPAF